MTSVLCHHHDKKWDDIHDLHLYKYKWYSVLYQKKHLYKLVITHYDEIILPFEQFLTVHIPHQPNIHL